MFLVSLCAGVITLGAYKIFFEQPNISVVSESDGFSAFNTSLTPTSAKGSGINEVDFTTAAETTVHAVVHVKNVTVSTGPSSIKEFFYGSGGSQRAQVGTGSGVIITPDGYIVTNNHVIKNASKLQVTLNNNKTYDAELIGADPNSDIALIKIDSDTKLPYLAFGDSDNTKIGEWVLAVGNPFNLTSTVTAGIVSAKARNLDQRKNNQSFIQTDAAVNPGNSGGALVNTNGDLVGINTAISSQTGSYVGYSFAVPSNIAKKVVEDIMEYGNVQKGIIGIKSVPINTPYAVKNLNDRTKKEYRTEKGVLITGVPETYRGYGLEDKVMIAVDDEDINDIQEARDLFGGISQYGRTSITLLNKNGERERLIFQ
ncbi:UNVERIFIED_CONTAM: hypothetical protein GTU68_011193 [Idotea baltica]|nr:hypothetical protein [Idotea baltica]